MRMMLNKSAVVYSCTGLLLLLVCSMFLNGTPAATGMLSTWTKSGGLSGPMLETPNIVEVVNQNAETQSSNDLDTPLPTSSPHQPALVPPSPPPPGKHALTQNQHNTKEFELTATKNNGKVVLLTGATGLGHFQQVDDFHNKVKSNRLEYVERHGTLGSFALTENRL
jgi:hypothetical protein